MLDLDETIAAVASPPGGAARGIVRVSGPNVLAIIAGLFSADEPGVLQRIRLPTAVVGRLALRGLFSPLPCTLYFWPSTRSYTRQPTVELHTLGSPPLLQAVLGEVCRAGARPARPGEFTLRAFLAGRLDLTQAEAVLGVIDARGPQQLAAALAQLAGGLAAPLTQLRNDLLDLLAHLEAGLDFVDEDIEFISHDELTSQLTAAGNEIDRLVKQMESRAEASDALRAVLIGAANVGKTSLYNALTGQTALVSPQAGTTRDYLRTQLDLDGVACELIDTAGLQPTPAIPAFVAGLSDAATPVVPALVAGPYTETPPVVLALVAGPQPGSSLGPHQPEAPARTDHEHASLALRVDVEPRRHGSQGVMNHPGLFQAASAGPPPASDPLNHAAQRAAADVREHAEIEILCLDATRPLDAWEESFLSGAATCPRIVVLTKIDQPPAGESARNHQAFAADIIETSSVSGVGLDVLRARLRAIAADRDTDHASTGTAARCRDSLRQAAAALAHARELVLSRQGEELLAAELRLALDALGQVVGAVYTDDVLDRIFSRFCIGK